MSKIQQILPPANLTQLALAAALCLAGTPAFAQASTTLGTVNVTSSTEAPVKTDNASSAKFTAPLVDTPKTIQIIKKEVLEEQGAVTLMEALRNTPGITMQMGENGNTSAGDTFQLRGFSLQQSTFVDGIRDLGAVTRDTFNLEQVEIVKGAAGAETGRGAASGFINLISKQAHLGDESSASGTIGTASRKRATVDLNKQLSETSAFRLNAMAQDSGVDGRDYVKNKGYGLGLSYAAGLNTPTRVFLYSQHLRQNNVPDGGIPGIGYEGYTSVTGPKVRRENFYGSVNDREKVDADMFTVKVEHDLGEGTTVRNITGIVTEIASASREQSSGIEQVGHAVTDMDRVTQQNAALVEQSSAATQVLQEESEKLSRLTASFKL